MVLLKPDQLQLDCTYGLEINRMLVLVPPEQMVIEHQSRPTEYGNLLTILLLLKQELVHLL